MDVSGNTILITGGTSGIGLGMAQKFLELDNEVIICGRREKRLKEIKNEHPSVITKVCDVSEDRQRVALHEWVTEQYPEINVLVNNAGIQLKMDLTQPLDMDRVRSETDVNFYAPVHLSSLFAPDLKEKSNAAIINMSSGLAFTPISWMPVYCATKAALHSFSLSLRHQLKDQDVKVFELIPPSVDTELGHNYRSDPNASHGGMPTEQFIEEAFKLLKNDEFEAAIGQSKNLHNQREKLFEVLNSRRPG